MIMRLRLSKQRLTGSVGPEEDTSELSEPRTGTYVRVLGGVMQTGSVEPEGGLN